MITPSASDIDALKLAAFIAAFFINRQAGYIVALHLLWEWLYVITQQGFNISCLSATLYFIAAAQPVKLKPEIRNALWLLGCVYWLAALDYYLTDAITIFYVAFPYVINFIDLYIFIHLIDKGVSFVGINSRRRCIVNHRDFGV